MKMPALLREPLVHFLLLGLALFLLYGRVAPENADSRRIDVDRGRIDALSRQFQATWNRTPTAQEMSGLIDAYVHDEVLYREGLAMGLDADDSVVKRRVRQKLEVMSEEAIAQLAPTDAELSAFLDKHPETFRQAPVLGFEQVFFATDAAPAEVARKCAQALSALRGGAAPSSLGQATMLPAKVAAQSADDIDRAFGIGFARQLEALPLNTWQGPIPSNFGSHLVRINARRPAALPALATIRPAVLREWEADRRERNRQEMYRRMAANYRIVIDGKPVANGAAAP